MINSQHVKLQVLIYCVVTLCLLRGSGQKLPTYIVHYLKIRKDFQAHSKPI